MSKIVLKIKDKKPINLKLENPVVEIEPKLENIEITPSKEEQTFKSENYYGYDEVKVNGVTNEIDTNIKPENIKEGVSILGVSGNVEEVNATEIRITPISEEQTITPEEPYNGFNKVIVGAQSGINPEEYFETTITTSNYNNFGLSMLKKIPNLNIDDNVTSMSYGFSNLQGIKTIPLLNTSKVTNMYYMFNGCTNLKTIPLLDTSKVTNMSYMFNNCANLETIPLLDTSKVTNMSYMFYGCTNLETIPLLNTSSVTDMSSMFSMCPKIKEILYLDTSSVMNLRSMFMWSNNIETICELNGSNVTSISQIFGSQSNSFTDFGGIKDLGKAYLTTRAENYSSYTLDLSYCPNLTHESLMNVINGLYDIANIGVKPQKLVLGSSNLAKLTADEIAIATNKGWNVS